MFRYVSICFGVSAVSCGFPNQRQDEDQSSSLQGSAAALAADWPGSVLAVALLGPLQNVEGLILKLPYLPAGLHQTYIIHY